MPGKGLLESEGIVQRCERVARQHVILHGIGIVLGRGEARALQHEPDRRSGFASECATKRDSDT
jgi:hypothetical protein